MKRIVLSICLAVSASIALAADFKALVLTDIHYVPGQAKTVYAENGSPSDTGDDLFQSFTAQVKFVADQVSPDVTFILGDLPGHGLSNRRHADQTVLNGLWTVLPKKPVFYVAGNNDTFGGNYHSFSQLDLATGKLYSPLQLFENHIPGKNVAASCSDKVRQACFIDNGIYQNHPFYFGYYSAYLSADRSRRLVALNSVMFLGKDYYSSYTADDGVQQIKAAQLQLVWLKKQLQDASKKHESVILAMHIPSGINSYSGSTFWLPQIQRQFQRLIARYRENIVVMLSGHTHMNELHLYTDGAGGAVLAMGVPGITPLHGNDPGFSLLYFSNHYLNAQKSTSYRFDPATQRWGRYDNFMLCSLKSVNLQQLMQFCSQADVKKWTLTHFAQGNLQFKPAQGREPIEREIWLNVN